MWKFKPKETCISFTQFKHLEEEGSTWSQPAPLFSEKVCVATGELATYLRPGSREARRRGFSTVTMCDLIYPTARSAACSSRLCSLSKSYINRCQKISAAFISNNLLNAPVCTHLDYEATTTNISCWLLSISMVMSDRGARMKSQVVSFWMLYLQPIAFLFSHPDLFW